MIHAIHQLAEDIRRQVKKHRDKRRGREKRAQRMLARAQRARRLVPPRITPPGGPQAPLLR